MSFKFGASLSFVFLMAVIGFSTSSIIQPRPAIFRFAPPLRPPAVSIQGNLVELPPPSAVELPPEEVDDDDEDEEIEVIIEQGPDDEEDAEDIAEEDGENADEDIDDEDIDDEDIDDEEVSGDAVEDVDGDVADEVTEE